MSKKKYGPEYSISLNESNEYALVNKEIKVKPSDVFPTLLLKVYFLEGEEEVYNSTIAKGKVKWINNEEILIESIPGQVQNEKEKTNKYLYNVYSRVIKEID